MKKGFTLIELMIAVAIIAILAAVAIPAYLGYLRRSYLSEATSSISAIKSAQESYFTINGCYISAPAWPATIPGGITADWETSGRPGQWGQGALAVRPDRRVRFQYQVYATNSWTASAPCAAPTDPSGLNNRNASVGCVSNLSTNLIPASVFPTNWYVVNVRGNLDNDAVGSNIISAIDDSTVIMCDELE